MAYIIFGFLLLAVFLWTIGLVFDIESLVLTGFLGLMAIFVLIIISMFYLGVVSVIAAPS